MIFYIASTMIRNGDERGEQISLPAIPAPLLPPDADVPLALQAALEACFALVGYQRLLDYTQPPPPPLAEADLAWMKEVIKVS